MPKERFHLLLTDLYRSRNSIPRADVCDQPHVVSIGAISPDIFFYDLPSFSLNSLGDSLHNLMARDGLDPILSWLGTHSPTQTAKSWAVGFACHFLADAIWHPIIDDLSGSLESCKRNGLTTTDCHRFIESEMEGFWLPKIGEPGGYIDLLDSFRGDGEWLGGIASIYRRFLAYAGLETPSEGKILRCFLNQNFLLRLFANKVLARQRDCLLAMRPTRYFAALVTPARPVLPFSHLPENHTVLKLFSNEFMERELTSLFALLSDFEERLSLSLPS